LRESARFAENGPFSIQADEKLLLQPSFRAPMLAKIPYPPWALRKEDVDATVGDGGPADAPPTPASPKKSRREADFA
jgi:uncharacterized protein